MLRCITDRNLKVFEIIPPSRRILPDVPLGGHINLGGDADVELAQEVPVGPRLERRYRSGLEEVDRSLEYTVGLVWGKEWSLGCVFLLCCSCKKKCRMSEGP